MYCSLLPNLNREELTTQSRQIALWYNYASTTEKLAATIEKDFGVKARAYKCAVENFDEVCSLDIKLRVLEVRQVLILSLRCNHKQQQ
jgi:hypothetical protein